MIRGLGDLSVAAASGASRYCATSPFNPPELYPEHERDDVVLDPSNLVYPMVRDALILLGLDRSNLGSKDWNPLAEIINPGDRVLIKPNFVLHFNAGRGTLEAVVTHPSVIRPIVDYVLKALGGRGQIVVGDAPQMNCDLRSLFQAIGMDALADYLELRCVQQGVGFKAVDFRQERTTYKHGIVWKRRKLAGPDPLPVVLGRESFLDPIDTGLLYGADYRRSRTVSAHANHRHEYLITPYALESDVIISVPKLKVHRKVGTTLNLKNMVGINTDKNHLAHYRIGAPARGGDEFSDPRWDDSLDRVLSDALLGAAWRVGKYPFLAWRAARKLLNLARPPQSQSSFTYGNWHGNDTAWRMAVDLNRIVFFARPDGTLSDQPVRRYFSVVDGVIGGDGEGPLAPDPYPSGVVLAGFNPVAVDWIATLVMGLDPERMPIYSNAVKQMCEWVRSLDPAAFNLISNVEGAERPAFKFRPASGWAGHIERYTPDLASVGRESGPAGILSQ